MTGFATYGGTRTRLQHINRAPLYVHFRMPDSSGNTYCGFGKRFGW